MVSFRIDIWSSLRRQDHLGYWTIGVGRLIDKRKGEGLSAEESAYLLSNDIEKRDKELQKRLPWAVKLDDARYGVLLNMAFQMGVDVCSDSRTPWP